MKRKRTITPDTSKKRRAANGALTAFDKDVSMSWQLAYERGKLFKTHVRDSRPMAKPTTESIRRRYTDVDEHGNRIQVYVTDAEIADAITQILLLQDKLDLTVALIASQFAIPKNSLVCAISFCEPRSVKYWKQIQTKLQAKRGESD